MKTTLTTTRLIHPALALLLLPCFALADATSDVLAAFTYGQWTTGYSTYTNVENVVEETPLIRYYVGYCHEKGLGGAVKDIAKAKAYYAAAAEKGESRAKEALERLAAQAAIDDEIEKTRELFDNATNALERIKADRMANKTRIHEEREKERKDHQAEIERKDAEIEGLKKAGKAEAADLVAKALADAEEKYGKQMKKAEEERRKSDAAYEEQIKRLEDVVVGLKKRVRELEMKLINVSHPISPVTPPPQVKSTAVGGQESPLGFAMFAPAQFPSVEADVTGFRLSIFYGRNHDVFGLDIGALVSVADGDLMGLEVSGLFNKIGTSSGSMQIGGIANDCQGDFLGLQIAGIANRAKGEFLGAQIGTLNLASGKMGGVQIGAFNNAADAAGVQIGVVNHASRMIGVQIGLINLIDNAACPCLPVINANF